MADPRPAFVSRQTPSPLLIDEVNWVDSEHLDWAFITPFSFTGTVCPQLQTTDGGAPFFSPFAVAQVAPNILRAHYPGLSLSPGESWRIITYPAGFPAGAVTVPQSGIVN